MSASPATPPALPPAMSPGQWGLLIVLAILWGGSFFFNGVLVKELPPLTLVLVRVALAALTLAPLLVWRGLKLPHSLQGWWPFIGMALFNNVAPFLLIARGQKEIASGLAAVMNASTPVWGLILAHLLTRDEKLKANKLVGALIGVAGVAALIGPEALLGNATTTFGMLLGVGGAICYGLSTVWGRRLRSYDPLLTAFCQLSCSTLLLAPVTILIDRPWSLPAPSGTIVAAMLGLAVLSTALGYIVFFRILAVSGPQNAMLVTLLNPVSAIALGVMVLGETLQWRHVAGALVIAAALLLIDGRFTRWLRQRMPVALPR